MTYKMRKPLVKNKYNLTIKQLKKYKVVDRTHVGLPFFWRNDVIGAWCICVAVFCYNRTSHLCGKSTVLIYIGGSGHEN